MVCSAQIIDLFVFIQWKSAQTVTFFISSPDQKVQASFSYYMYLFSVARPSVFKLIAFFNVFSKTTVPNLTKSGQSILKGDSYETVIIGRLF